MLAATPATLHVTAAPTKKVTVVSKTVTGPAVETGRWGPVEVTLVVKKTTTTTTVAKTKKKKTTVARKITGVNVPVYPNHTDRSIFINQQALPYLQQEVLQAQFNANIDLISGATDTSMAFVQSLQAALLSAKKA